MEIETTISEVDFAGRLRRSRGRSGRTFVASAKVTRAELTELEDAAGANGKALSEWSRDTLLREARRPKDDVLLTEIVATRMLLVLLLQPLALGETLTRADITEIMGAVRLGKRKATRDMLQQYKVPEPEEGSDGE